MNPEKIAEGKRLCEAATPGPWCIPPKDHVFANEGDYERHLISEVHQYDRLDDIDGCVIGERGCYSDSYGGIISGKQVEDAELICFLRNHATTLLSAADRCGGLERALREVRRCKQLRDCCQCQDMIDAALSHDGERRGSRIDAR